MTDIAFTVAVTALAPGAGNVLTAALMSTTANMVDDAVFTALDVQNGQMEAGDAWGGLAKKGATNLATSVIGSSFNTGFGGEFKGFQNNPFIQNSVFASTGMKAVELTANMAVSNGINAIEWENGLNFNQKGFYNSFEGPEAWAGVAAGTAGHFVNSQLNNWTLQTRAGTSFTGISGAVDVEALKNFSSMAGNLTNTAVTYGITGNAKVNLLNTKLFHRFGLQDRNGDPISTGLLEYSFGDNGNQFSIGSGGVGIDLTSTLSSLKGLGVAGKISGMKWGGIEGNTRLETVAMYDNTSNAFNHSLARGLFDKSIDLKIGNGMSSEDIGYRGMYDANNPNTITVNQDMLGNMTQEDYARIAAIVSHESTHMAGNRIEAFAHQQGLGTYQELVTNLELTGDGSFTNEMVSGVLNPENWKMNSGSMDYWKLIENPDGSLTLNDDGRGGVFYDSQDGEELEIGHFIGGSRTEHLQKILSLELTPEEKARLNNEMLVGQGSAEEYKNGSFLDKEGKQISIDLTGEWSDRMGAALDYDRMFVTDWRTNGNMNSMIGMLNGLNYLQDNSFTLSSKHDYLADKLDQAKDFDTRFKAGTAEEHLFSQTEIENEVGMKHNSLCYVTVPINAHQLTDPTISLDMIGDTLNPMIDNRQIGPNGTIYKYENYLIDLATGLKSSEYLSVGKDYTSLQEYLKSDYSMADVGIYGNRGKEHHSLYRNDYDPIDPYPFEMSWDITSYRYRALVWEAFQ